MLRNDEAFQRFQDVGIKKIKNFKEKVKHFYFKRWLEETLPCSKKDESRTLLMMSFNYENGGWT